MPNGVRNSIWALFFLAGMAFMAALIFMVRPDLFSNQAVRQKPGSLVVVGAAEREDAEIETELAPTVDQAPDVRRPVRESLSAEAEKQKAKVEGGLPVAEPQPEARPEPASTQPQPPLPLPVVHANAALPSSSEIIRHVRPGRAVFGHVSLLGDLPPLKELPVADGFCGPRSTATTMVSRVYIRAKDNSLADALVYLESRTLEKHHWMEPAQPAIVTQRNCQFEPYVTAIQLGQRVAFENLDPVLHNVHTRPTVSRNHSINVAQRPKGKSIIAEFAAPETFIRVECNVHPYMVAYVCVMPHPFFAVTKEDGRFQIPNVPVGEYTLRATHRRAGAVERRVRVTDEEVPEVELVLHAPNEIAQAN